MSKKLNISLLSLGMVLAAVNASADTATGSLNVTANVQDTCAVASDGNTLAFGTYYSGQSAALDQDGSLSVKCSSGTGYSVGLGDGSWATTSGDPTTRHMRASGGASFLPYMIYQDSARTTVWGNDSGNWLGGRTATGSDESIPVYGRIAGGNSVAEDSYSDTVNITVTYS